MDRPMLLTRHGRRVGVRHATEEEALGFLAGWERGGDVAGALAEGGYAIIPVPADRLSDLERREYASTARRCFDHDHPGYVAYDREERALVRENCGAGPNYAGWVRVYVEAGRTVPAAWRAAFERERETPDNRRYADALALSVATFGVRFSDGTLIPAAA